MRVGRGRREGGGGRGRRACVSLIWLLVCRGFPYVHCHVPMNILNDYVRKSHSPIHLPSHSSSTVTASLTHSPTISFILNPTHLPSHSSPTPLTPSQPHSLTHQLFHSSSTPLTYPLIHPQPHSPTLSFIPNPTHTLTASLTHSLTNYFIYPHVNNNCSWLHHLRSDEAWLAGTHNQYVCLFGALIERTAGCESVADGHRGIASTLKGGKW